MKGEVLVLISNALGKGVALNCLHQLFLITTGENPTKTWKL
jgi:hypothetical protein